MKDFSIRKLAPEKRSGAGAISYQTASDTSKVQEVIHANLSKRGEKFPEPQNCPRRAPPFLVPKRF
jgi:hypothetical protein